MKLHSVHTLLKSHRFEGRFELSGTRYDLVYSPSRAAIVDKRLQLKGDLSITDANGRKRDRSGVALTLASSQGGIGSLPSNLTPLRSRMAKTQPDPAAAARLMATDSTGPGSFAGVLYFHCERLDGREMGVPGADLERVQINLRMAPIDPRAATLQGLFSALVDSLLAEPKNLEAAETTLAELNRFLASA